MNNDSENIVEWHWEISPGSLATLFRRFKEPVTYTKETLKEAVELLELEEDIEKDSEEYISEMHCLSEGLKLLNNPPKEESPKPPVEDQSLLP